jgi:two-component system KDP operon response regulator KdpE
MTAERSGENLPRILVIDDELAIRRFLHTVLSNGEFTLHEAENGHAGLAAAATGRPDVILLDLGLPDLDGIEVIRRIREWSQVPIIVLSVREHEDDKVAALDAGADDYLTKPFGVGELVARLRAMLRRGARTPESAATEIAFGDVTLDIANHTVTRGGQGVKLTPVEFRLLAHLAVHPGKVLTHRHLLREVWGPSHVEHGHYLRVYMGRLRGKLEADPARPRYILTEPGAGYRLVNPSER